MTSTKTAFITGITGQDGSYLTELLLSKGYHVHGLIRRSSTFNTERLDPLFQGGTQPDLSLHYGDMTDSTALNYLIHKIKPDEIYNLAAQSHVKVSFDVPEFTADVVATGTLTLLEAARNYSNTSGHKIRFYQAGSSEMYGSASAPQNEETPFHPRSPYAVSKVAAHWYGINYRESYNMFICNGILFNHESPRRGENFVTRKITRAVGRIKYGLQNKLYLGNLDAKRDWGFAGDYVEAMWLMLQQEQPDDYVIATGASYSVRDFLELAFGHVSLNWKDFVEVDPRYFRPAEVEHLKGIPTKAIQKLNWKPKVDLPALVKMMVETDLILAEQEKSLINAGFGTAPRGLAAGLDLRGIKNLGSAC